MLTERNFTAYRTLIVLYLSKNGWSILIMQAKMQRSYGAYARTLVLAVTQRSQFGAKFICDEFLTPLMARLSNEDICSFDNDYVDISISDKYITKKRGAGSSRTSKIILG